MEKIEIAARGRSGGVYIRPTEEGAREGEGGHVRQKRSFSGTRGP